MFTSSIKMVLCGFLIHLVKASPLDELKEKYSAMVMECAGDYPLTVNDVELLKNKQLPESDNAKCLFACAYKKSGMMNDQGELSIAGIRAIIQKYLSDDPVTLKKAEDFTDACKSVNDEPVSDGTKGCERAALIYKCSLEKAPQFDLTI